jgi:16S rRNA (uracil1498-N3)-methyltransferase
VNLILFELHETTVPLPRADRRAVHLLEVLRRHVHDTFDAGLINGPRGKGTVTAIDSDALHLLFRWETSAPGADPITLIVGLPRPQTARKILQDATSLGITQLHFVQTDRGEPSYASSTLWSTGEWRRHLVAGAEQAFCTRLPEVSHDRPLSEIVALLPADHLRIALDNYESSTRLGAVALDGRPVVLAVGSERGWSPAEREILRRENFRLAHLGRRVLRTETACVAALAVVKDRSGFPET